MRLVVCVGALFFFCACRKEKQMIEINEFRNKYLTCDSIKTVVDGKESTTLKGPGTGMDVMFTSDNNLIVYSVPKQQFQYYVRYSKVYFWPSSVSMHEGDYYKIANKNGNHLHLEHRTPGTDNRTFYYYTAY